LEAIPSSLGVDTDHENFSVRKLYGKMYHEQPQTRMR
jgi:hypothetical protein